MSFLAQAAVFLAAAVIAVAIFRRLKLSSILGYIAAGLVIGPFGLGLIRDVDSILHDAEFGVVLLLFVIGLELQPTRLWVMRRVVFGLGTAQVALCTAALGAAAWLLGLTPTAAFIVGFGLSLSSTALVLQVLAERGQLRMQHGRAAFGILLFQDLAVLPMLAVLPLMSGSSTSGTGSNWWVGLVSLIGVIVAIVIGGRYLLRPALRIVARTRSSEVFTAAALLTVIGTALLVNRVGLSMSLGAFLAGVLLADSEFRHELEADIEPFKGLLLGLFFIAVGMSANLGLLTRAPLQLLGLTLGFILIKALVVALVGGLARQSADAAWRLGFTLPAGGEFAFVLFTLAARQRLLAPRTADLLVLAVTFSMMLGPLLLTLYDATLHRLLAREPRREFDKLEEREQRVIVAGFGRFGQIVARVLRARHISFTALDANQTHVDFVRRFGNRVYYGDASRLDLLRAAGCDTADVFVLAIDDVEASVRTAELVREQFPQLRLFARARNRQHAFALMDLGVTDIIRETYGSSLEMAERVLITLGDTPATARAAMRKFRSLDEAMLAAQYAVKDDDEKFLATSRESARQLEKLFAADELPADEQQRVLQKPVEGTPP
jgi:glutathione-regulated potassium-efflux system ancillary protein KefC/glutathione-regulated potassium-efflux system protein KefB